MKRRRFIKIAAGSAAGMVLSRCALKNLIAKPTIVKGRYPLQYVKAPIMALEELPIPSMTGKLFKLPGKNKFSNIVGIAPIHYEQTRGSGIWLDADTRVLQTGNVFCVHKALYDLETRGVGFDYNSKGLGRIEIDLLSITQNGIETTATNFNIAPVISGDRVKFVDVIPGIDIEFELRVASVKPHKIIKSGNFPIVFKWRSKETNMEDIIHRTPGLARDNTNRTSVRGSERIQRIAEVLVGSRVSKGGNIFEITETFTGRTAKVINQVTRQKEWRTGETVFPIIGNQDITEDISADNDDGQEEASLWVTVDASYPSIFFGETANKDVGFRFLTVAVGNGDTIDAGTQLSGRTRTYVSGTATADCVADVSSTRQDAFSSSSAPTDFTDSTASTSLSLNATNTNFTVNVVAIMQELVDLGGWATNDNCRFAFLEQEAGGDYAGLNDFDNDPSLSMDLEINFTAAVAVTRRKVLF